MNSIKEFNISLEKPVKMYYGYDILNSIFDYIDLYEYDKLFIISDKTIINLHGETLLQCFESHKKTYDLILIDSGEKSKSFTYLEQILNNLVFHNASKDSIIIGFGGGVVGNICGLAAALLYRGVRYIEIPTTFMGQTDSSLSNKQAINGKSGKNQFGVYKNPIFIWSDLKYTTTEEVRNFNAGIIEGIKNCLIYDHDKLSYFFDHHSQKYQESPEQLLNLFESIIYSKNKILQEDPTEKEFATILEYGHTFGHAIEFMSNGEINHGEAVAIGMCIASEVSFLIDGLEQTDVDLHYNLFVPCITKDSISTFIAGLDAEYIYQKIQNDNKRNKKGVQFVVLSQIGTCMNHKADGQINVDKDIIIKGMETFRDRYMCYVKMDEATCEIQVIEMTN